MSAPALDPGNHGDLGGEIEDAVSRLLRREAEGRRAIEMRDHAPIGMLAVGPSGVILDANPAAEDLSRVEQGSLAGRNIEEFMASTAAEMHRSRLAAKFAEIREHAEIAGPHCPLWRRADGTERPVRIYVSFPAGRRAVAYAYIVLREGPDECRI